MFIIPSSSVSRRSDGILQLTPLADFTMNQPDESFELEVSYIGHQHRQQYSTTGKRVLSLSVKDLVQRIADVEPYEPFWEHMKQLELPSKNLYTLHMLSKFCSALEELDVSNNQISQLDGAPRTIRHLRLSNNCLSDLTSWSQMCNLQYIDISNNGLTSLDGLKDLVHLRGLRADNNKIQSLEGIMCLDGLINLRLRGNMVQSVDFAACRLQRLTELDLKGNCIRRVRGLCELRSLTTLNLEDNDMDAFPKENIEALWALKYLKLGGNKLEDLDVTGYPNLRLLYLDRNRLRRVTGLHQVRHLDSLSLREQQDGARIDPEFLDEAFEVRKLFLSGNLLTTFSPSVDFLNLQYLELANCGLETLPEELGQMISNVRVLNLNFNALEDIKPLLGIVRLKKLHLAGNRLARIRRTTNVLAYFSSLTRVDLRNNPLTLGFYPPVSEKRLVLHDILDAENEMLPFDPFTLEDGDRDRDAAYAGRLDMGTKMRRRVFEILMLGGSTRLKMLDGLAVDRAAMAIKDKVWEELVKAGIIYDDVADMPVPELESQTSKANTENEAEIRLNERVKEVAHEEAPAEERWPAEDSFA
jgi:Leucine-rich repeat (LRR) protein